MNEKDLKQLICDKFLDGDQDIPIDRNTKLLDEGICDSLGLVQLVVEMEKRFPEIGISDQEITRENFDSIGAMLDFLARKRA
jgi:acyl carrier protein